MSKVSIRFRKIKNGKESVYLDYYPPIRSPRTGKVKRTETLGLFTYSEPANRYQRSHNRETLLLVENIRCRRQIDVQNRKFGFISNKERDADFIAFFAAFMRKKQTSTSDQAAMAVKYFMAFAGGEIKISELTIYLCEEYKSFLLSGPGISRRGRPIITNTAVSYFAKFRTALKELYRLQLIQDDLYKIVTPINCRETHRERLEMHELQRLAATSAKSEVIKNACLFSALTGLRFSDVSSLTWAKLRGTEGGYSLQFVQEKTDGAENLPISDQARALMGERGDENSLVFAGLLYHRLQSFLKDWLSRAGINRNITFHGFRHTYATLQLQMGTDIYTVSKMLGHRSIKTTEIYTKVVDKKKIEATTRIRL